MDTSALAQQVHTIAAQLHGLFDDIGVPGPERETREAELLAALSETLHEQVRLVTCEKKSMVEEAQRMIGTIRQMESSLEGDERAGDQGQREDDGLIVSYPLSRCLQTLKEKHVQVCQLHNQRLDQVRKLAEALDSYSSHLEPSFVRVRLPPSGPGQPLPPSFDLSPAYVDRLDQEFGRVYDEYTHRAGVVQTLAQQIISLWAELGIPQGQTEPTIAKYYRDAPEQLGLHEEDIGRLRARRDRLAEEKKTRERRLQSLRAAVEALWQRLGVAEEEQQAFVDLNRGCGLRQINEFESELGRLNELKRQNLHLFVEEARYRLQELWDGLFFSEDEMLEFTPAFSDVHSDALLEAHEREIGRLEALQEQRAPILALVDRHRALARERDELAAASQDASRLMARGQKGEKRDPGKLLREEKSRKRIGKELPRAAAELRKALERWEDEYGRPFCVHGERYLDRMDEEAQAQPAPPGARSKTPAGPAPAQTPQAPHPPPSRNGATSVSRANSTAKAAPPSRFETRTPTDLGRHQQQQHQQQQQLSTKRSQLAQTTIADTKGSPTRIPARAPLSSLKCGMNSPERPRHNYGHPDPRPESAQGRAQPASMRAPPPKMRDLMAAPEFESSIIRAVEPEDVYDDRPRELRHARSRTATAVAGYDDENGERTVHGLPHAPSKSTFHHHPLPHRSRPSSPPTSSSNSSGSYYEECRPGTAQSMASYHHGPPPPPPPPPPPVPSATAAPRQIFNSSHGSTTASGSENWETYDDSNSEPELDVSDTYYAKVQAARTRIAAGAAPAAPQATLTRRFHGGLPPPAPPAGRHITVDAEGNRTISGGGDWEDEDGP